MVLTENWASERAVVGAGQPCRIILVKFFFTNPKHIPFGIPEVDRATNSEMDREHFQMAYDEKYGYLAKEGRIREGRVDTGNHFIQNIQDVNVGCLMKGLPNVGYKMTHCHWFFQKSEKPGTSDKNVVVIGMVSQDYIKGKDLETLKLPQRTVEQRRTLSRTCWQWCHGWANPNGVLTLNFGGRKADGKPKHAVVVRNYELGAVKTLDPFSENDE